MAMINFRENTDKSYIDIICQEYVNHCHNFIVHISRLFKKKIINHELYHKFLKKVDNLIKQMLSLENSVNRFGTNRTDLSSIYQMRKKLILVEKINNVQYSPKDIISPIRKSLQRMILQIGTKSIHHFLSLFIDNDYHLFFTSEQIRIIEFYNIFFTILYAKIEESEERIPFSIVPTEKEYPNLFYHTCQINFNLPGVTKKISFGGYVIPDVLNIAIRTSCFDFSYFKNIHEKIKTYTKNLESPYEKEFYRKYLKLGVSSFYFCTPDDKIIQVLHTKYQEYHNFCNMKFNNLIKLFTMSDIKEMSNMINLLMLGSEQNIYQAVVLFETLKDNTSHSYSLTNIIYKNLPYYHKIKLRSQGQKLKIDVDKIKSISIEDVSIERKIAMCVNMPDDAKKYIMEKNNEVKSGENSYKVHVAINGLLQFPWKPKNEVSIFSQINSSRIKTKDYLKNVAQKLNDRIYGHEESKKILLELVGQWICNPKSSGQIIGICGPPGVGKTLFAQSISDALGIPMAHINLGGMNDSADLVGHSFTYTGSQYGMIVRQMIKVNHWRCIILFDEVDKVAKKHDINEIYNTLIHITDKNMNEHFQDRFYSSSVDFDLSGVLMIFSYNNSENIDPVLLDRIKEIKISSYNTEEKIIIAQKHILAELCQNINFRRENIKFDDETIRFIIENYTIEAGARELGRKIEKILLKLNLDRIYLIGPFREILENCYMKSVSKDRGYTGVLEEDHPPKLIDYIEGKQHHLEREIEGDVLNRLFNMDLEKPIVITKELVHRYLEKKIIEVEKIHKTDMIGVINGLYATTIGIGGIVPIQVYQNYFDKVCDENNLKLRITGNQKKIMRESVICAFTVAIHTIHERYRDVSNNFPNGFHVHSPDGSTLKDGPSAGCAFTIAFISILIGKKINHQVAMTGEIQLTGKISKIGGLDLKLTGAKKSGVKRVYVPEENRDDYEKFRAKNTQLFNENFEVLMVNHIFQIASDPYVILEIQDSDLDKISC